MKNILKFCLVIITIFSSEVCYAGVVPINAKFNAVVFDNVNKQFIAVGISGLTPLIISSKDGLNWVNHPIQFHRPGINFKFITFSEGDGTIFIDSDSADPYEHIQLVEK